MLRYLLVVKIWRFGLRNVTRKLISNSSLTNWRSRQIHCLHSELLNKVLFYLQLTISIIRPYHCKFHKILLVQLQDFSFSNLYRNLVKTCLRRKIEEKIVFIAFISRNHAMNWQTGKKSMVEEKSNIEAVKSALQFAH